MVAVRLLVSLVILYMVYRETGPFTAGSLFLVTAGIESMHYALTRLQKGLQSSKMHQTGHRYL